MYQNPYRKILPFSCLRWDEATELDSWLRTVIDLMSKFFCTTHLRNQHCGADSLSFFFSRRRIFEKETTSKRYFSEKVAVGPWAVLRRQHDARNVGAFTSTKKPMWRLYWIRKYVELLLWLTQECTLVVHRGGYLDPHDQNCDSIHKDVELLLGRFHTPGWFRWYYKEQNARLQ